MQHFPRYPLPTIFLFALSSLQFLSHPLLAEEIVRPAPATHHQQTIPELIADLRSPNFATREAATGVLIRLSTDHRSDIEDALASEKDEEAIARLTRIATHMFLKNHTQLFGHVALLGIAFSLEYIQTGGGDLERRPSVAVAYVQPGFPAAEVLKPGDRLTAFNGTPFPNDMQADDFRGLVNASHPGSYVTFTVIRAGKQSQIPVQVAGVPDSAVGQLTEYIAQRTAAAAEFANSLKRGMVSEPIVLGAGAPANP